MVAQCTCLDDDLACLFLIEGLSECPRLVVELVLFSVASEGLRSQVCAVIPHSSFSSVITASMKLPL